MYTENKWLQKVIYHSSMTKAKGDLIPTIGKDLKILGQTPGRKARFLILLCKIVPSRRNCEQPRTIENNLLISCGNILLFYQKELKYLRAWTINKLVKGSIMTITNFDVQQILRTYHRQLGERSRLSGEKVNKRFVPQDAVTISPESKKRLLTDKIAQQILNRFLNTPERNETMQDIINRLSQEYGKPLDLSADDGQNFIFKVLNKENGQGEGSLSPAENEQLKKRFIDITKSIVYDNLV